MEMERKIIILGEFISRIKITPVHNVSCAFHTPPFAGIFRGYLIPVGFEVVDLCGTVDIPNKFRLVGG